MRIIAKRFIRSLVRQLSRMVMRLEFVGWENLPPSGPLIVIGNHFGIFEAPLMMAFLPYENMTFLVATEIQESRIMRFLVQLYDAIPVWRGQPDRDALRAALAWLESGAVLGIMPEGSVDPGLQAQIEATGQQTGLRGGPSARQTVELLPPRPGAAYLAVRSGAPVLPVAVLGGEQVLVNLRKLRRTTVTMTIGEPFGPLKVDETLPKVERRHELDNLGHIMMRHLAELLPAQNRGQYS